MGKMGKISTNATSNTGEQMQNFSIEILILVSSLAMPLPKMINKLNTFLRGEQDWPRTTVSTSDLEGDGELYIKLTFTVEAQDLEEAKNFATSYEDQVQEFFKEQNERSSEIFSEAKQEKRLCKHTSKM